MYHSLLWLLYLLITMWLRSSDRSLLFDLRNTVVSMFFFGGVVYTNLYYLMPQYLAKKKPLTYLLLLVGLCVVITPLKVLTVFFMMSGLPDYQQLLLQNQPTLYGQTLLVAGVSTLLKIVREWVRQNRLREDLERENLQSELRFLRAQINPHFFFNTLNSIYALTLKKSDEAPDMVLRLSDMMRYMLYECNERMVPLSKEINYLQNYIELEKLRHGSKIKVTFRVEGIVGDLVVAPLIFIVFVENSFKHGLSNQLSDGFVDIRLSINEEEIVFCVENSKTAAHDAHYHQGGIGLINTRRRLDILYPALYKLDIDNGPEVYSVHLKIRFAHD